MNAANATHGRVRTCLRVDLEVTVAVSARAAHDAIRHFTEFTLVQVGRLDDDDNGADVAATRQVDVVLVGIEFRIVVVDVNDVDLDVGGRCGLIWKQRTKQ